MTTRTETIKTLGRDIGLSVALVPSASTAPCAPKPTGLYWFSDATGEFDQEAEASYLLLTGAAGPVLGLARVLGETCGDVQWAHVWTPEQEGGGSPVFVESGADLIVYPLATTAPGELSVTATCAGRTFGPILLTVLREPVLTLGWRDFYDVFTATDVVGMIWSANPKAVTADLFTANLAVAEGYALPDSGRRVRVSFTPDPGEPTTWEIQFKFGSDNNWYLFSDDTMPKTLDIDTEPLTSVRGYFPNLQPTGQLTISVECYGP